MHVVVVVNILNNHSSHVVYNTRPQAYDTESLDLEKTSWEENTQKIHISFYCHWYPNLSRIFSGFPIVRTLSVTLSVLMVQAPKFTFRLR